MNVFISVALGADRVVDSNMLENTQRVRCQGDVDSSHVVLGLKLIDNRRNPVMFLEAEGQRRSLFMAVSCVRQ
jgi:hypothetical protein